MRILVLYPNEASYIGLYQPEAQHNWVTKSVELGTGENAVLQAVDTLLKKNNVVLDSLTHVGGFVGPAPYTQLRVMITTANTLAWSLGKPIIAIDLSDRLPHDLPRLCNGAKLGNVIEPKYPHEIA